MPFLNATSVFLVAQFLEDVKNPFAAMFSDLWGTMAGVQHAAQDFLSLTQSPFTFQNLPFRDSFLALCCHFIWLQEASINGVHDASLDILAMVTGALGNSDD